MQTFPLELDNALFTFNLFSIYQIFIQLICFSWNISNLNWHFGLIGLRIIFWIFLSLNSFGTMVLLLWFLIFKLLSIFKLNDFSIVPFSSDLNILTTFSGIYYFLMFVHSDIQFLLSSSLLNIIWLSTKVFRCYFSE